MRMLGWLWSRTLLYLLLVVAIAAALLIGPTLNDWPRLIGEETRSKAQVISQIDLASEGAQLEFEQTARDAKAMPVSGIEQRIRQRQIDLVASKAALTDSKTGFLASYRPNKILSGKRAQIKIALIEQELALLQADKARKKAEAFFYKYPKRPTAKKVAAAARQCDQANAALTAFNARWDLAQLALEVALNERTVVTQRRADQCQRATDLQRQRETHLRIEAQRDRAAALRDRLASTALPQVFTDDVAGVTLRDILVQALLALIVITLTPFIYRTMAYYVLAPIAARAAPLRFADAGSTPPQPTGGPSAVSAAITLGPREEALVRQDYLQSSSLTGAKRLRWLLDWHHPLTSLASGMRFLTAISGDGERVTVSAVKDPFAELAVLIVPAGAACVLRPSALAAVVQPQGAPVMIRSQWRFALPAWLTWQWRYMVFHGPVRLVVKGGRGVRIEPAARGRIVGEGQTLGFSTDLAYAVIRSETFWPYVFGREALLKDKVEAGNGVLLIEEAPLIAGRSGLKRGMQGVGDALLKVFGV